MDNVGEIVSIYAELLGSALDQSHLDEDTTFRDALAHLVECRNRLGADLSSYTDWAPAAVADQLAYDIALIELSRRLSIDVDLARFRQPQHERRRLEQALAAHGVQLEEFDAPTVISEQSQRTWGQRRR